ncbi:MAG: hypothetical protein FWC26_06520 [Fibromonadales bacterium]|nr:hypothetical protein [Fibromonadales bacterium]
MDDVILESLKPQVEEMAQGNHINHIDMRVDALDGKFNALSTDFAELLVDFAGLRAGFEKLRADVRSEISEFGTKFESKLAGLDVKLEKFRGDSSRMTAVIGSICAASIALATLITNIMSR